MNVEAKKFAAGLFAMGIRPGDRVAVWGPNQPEWLIMKWACAKAGVAMVNINPLYTARELEYALEKVDAKMLVCPKEIGPLDYDTTIRQMIPDLENRNSMNLKLPKLPLLEKIVYYSNSDNISGTILWSDLEKAGQSSDFREVDESKVDVNSTANIQFTSGTTGMPKAAALSHYSLTNNARVIDILCNSKVQNFDETSVLLNILPLYHVFSFVAGSLIGSLSRITNVFPAPGFNADLAIKAAEKRKTTHCIGTPTMFTDMINSPILSDHDLSSLNYALLGGAPVTPALVKDCADRLNCNVAVGYGMTENSCATFLTPAHSDEDIVCNTVGFPTPGLDAQVIG